MGMATTKELHTIRDYLRFTVSCLNEAGVCFCHGTDNAWDEAVSMVLHALHLPIDMGNEVLDARLLGHEKENILSLVRARVDERIPAPYLINQAWFCGLSFYVDDRVLIPRSPIAEIIEARFKPWYQGDYPHRILDLCTGSGCIGIACAYAFDEAEVVLADLLDDALQVAEKNIQRHQLEQRASLLKSDLFASVSGRFDIIVTNPPYVDAIDFKAMPREFHHEPSVALTSGELGLDHPLSILRSAADFLQEDGLLVLEVGNSGEHLERYYPEIDFNWVEFSRGGHGVVVMSKAELEAYADKLALSVPIEGDDNP